MKKKYFNNFIKSIQTDFELYHYMISSYYDNYYYSPAYDNKISFNIIDYDFYYYVVVLKDDKKLFSYNIFFYNKKYVTPIKKMINIIQNNILAVKFKNSSEEFKKLNSDIETINKLSKKEERKIKLESII